MNFILYPLIALISLALRTAEWVVVAYGVVNLLVQFNVLNKGNQFVNVAYTFLGKLLNPLLKRIRKIIPSLGGLDISPLVLFGALYFLDVLLSMVWIEYSFHRYFGHRLA